MITDQCLYEHNLKLVEAWGGIVATTIDGPITIVKSYNMVIKAMKKAHKKGKKVIFIGNGGSAAISSHMAIDYAKNGGIRAIAFNDASALTCTANDFGHEYAFARMVDTYADRGDIIVAISSSGRSVNIIKAVKAARENECTVYTLSGFSDNPLMKLGDINFHVPTKKGEYGFVEITHLSILHTILDLICEGK